ncbi:MAG TPA: hypothetical protein PKD54_05825 [Pirellulaceae bacterium]|nr:hypothetical protein [Pirellulaceae bacterium]
MTQTNSLPVHRIQYGITGARIAALGFVTEVRKMMFDAPPQQIVRLAVERHGG